MPQVVEQLQSEYSVHVEVLEEYRYATQLKLASHATRQVASVEVVRH